jgi:hypothetical protein
MIIIIKLPINGNSVKLFTILHSEKEERHRKILCLSETIINPVINVIIGAGGVLKNSYKHHCERQSLEAISAFSSLFLTFLDCFVAIAPRKDNRRHFFNSPAGPRACPDFGNQRGLPLRWA